MYYMYYMHYMCYMCYMFGRQVNENERLTPILSCFCISFLHGTPDTYTLVLSVDSVAHEMLVMLFMFNPDNGCIKFSVKLIRLKIPQIVFRKHAC
jgi:hypothetical protein